LDQKLINTGFTMNKLSKNLLATLSGFALVIFPQLTIAEGEEEAATNSGGSAAGDAAGKKRYWWS
jgi:hypothetical protein